jgi:dienelactone hydrolase
MDEQLENRLRFLRKANTEGMPHSDRGLFDHLLGTRQLLMEWGSRPTLGGVYAVAHVRGGGELGEEWRRAEKGPNKQNGIDDFIACADYLVTRGYTTPGKLAAKGTSAGGVVVGRALTQRPELFRAAILEVACLDALRFEKTRNGPPKVPEWGSVQTEDGFKALQAMSQYEHGPPTFSADGSRRRLPSGELSRLVACPVRRATGTIQ